ncbi:MAG: conjugal transfer protein TraF [Pseudomonadota bacterium]
MRMRKTALVLAAAISPCGSALGTPSAAPEKTGYWWYEDPKEEEPRQGPAIPDDAALAQLPPSDIQALIDAQLEHALVAQTPEAVADYYRLIDLSRRRSRGFAALSNVVLLENPELNARSAYPITNAARDELTRRRERERTERLQRARSEFALIMFSSERCAFCISQWNVMQYFAEQTGWIIKRVDVDLEPSKAARFNVQGTPMTVMIRRNSTQWFPVAVGSDSYPVLADNAYRAIRLMKGEINERQFFNGEGDDGGFFDPMAGGE